MVDGGKESSDSDICASTELESFDDNIDKKGEVGWVKGEECKFYS